MKDEQKQLELKVTVITSGEDPDAVLYRVMHRPVPERGRLKLIKVGGYGMDVVSVERADGQVIGAEAEFEECWRDGHSDGSEDNGAEETGEKMWAREAFMWGVKYGRKAK